MTLEEIEAHLRAGNLEVAMRSGRWWRCRKNGKTQTWVTRPTEFRIPIKAGLRSYGAIREGDMEAGFVRLSPFPAGASNSGPVPIAVLPTGNTPRRGIRV